MPLSEEEQRILQQIEQQFYESDPDFAHQVSATSLGGVDPTRSLKIGVLGFIAGLALLLGTLSVHVALAFASFLVMLASLVLVERSVRRLGRDGVRDLADRMSGRRLRTRLTPRRRRDD